MHGYDIPAHRARRVTAAELAERDLVLAMTSSHARALRALTRGADHLARLIRMLRSFDPAAPPRGPEYRLDVDALHPTGPQHADPGTTPEAGEPTSRQIRFPL